jgi:hypothetical protein
MDGARKQHCLPLGERLSQSIARVESTDRGPHRLIPLSVSIVCAQLLNGNKAAHLLSPLVPAREG